ncbi:MAG: DUF3352 domain-containing protein [Saprospiraceae bacterium]|nr:DUF3352 domain-containing protein [Saprospiraceae bacterium]
MSNLPSRTKQIALGALLAVAVLAIVASLFERKKSAYQALPSQAAVVLEFNSLSKVNLLKKSLSAPVWTDVMETTLFRNAWGDIAAAERLFGHAPALHEAFSRKKLLLALTLGKADSLHGLFTLDTETDINLKKLLETNSITQRIFPSVFHGRTLYTVYLDKNEPVVVAALGPLLLFSRYSYLVEDALGQLEKSQSWWAGRKAMNEFGVGAPLRLFFRPSAIWAQYENSTAAGWEHVPDMISKNVEWLGLAWNGREVTAFAETGGALRNAGWWGKATPEQDIFAVLPNNVALLAKAYFDRPRLFFDQIKKGNSDDFDRFVLPWIGDEAAWVVTEPFSQGMFEDQFIVLATRDSASALERLRDYARQRGALRVEDYQTFEVFEFAAQSLLSPLLGENSHFRNPCCAMIGRYVVFSTTRPALELWIDKHIVSQTLANDTDFLQLRQKKTAGTDNGQVLLNGAYLPLLLKNIFDPQRESFQAADVQALSKIGWVGLDLQPDGNSRLQVHVATQPLATAQTQASLLWKTPLGAPAATQPFIVEGSEGIALVMQDSRHELYRLNASGAVVWRRQMEEPILGAVQGIDFWGNGSLFFLFNTANRIWLLDDKGHDAQGFPLELLSPATNGVTAVDFDNNSKYSYFIACANGNLYGYDQFGRPLPGWNPQSGIGRVTHPVLHFQQGNKDYLAALNQAGRLFVFGRNGAERFPPVQFQGKDFGPPQADASPKAPRIVCANGAGTVFVCKLDGTSFNMQIGKGGKGDAHFVFTLLGGDARHDYALLKEKTLSASSYEGNTLRPLFQTTLPTEQDTLFAVPQHRLGTLNRGKRQIWLFAPNGQAYPEFPLAGTTPFAVSGTGQKQGQMLVVGDGSSVYAYKIYASPAGASR